MWLTPHAEIQIYRPSFDPTVLARLDELFDSLWKDEKLRCTFRIEEARAGLSAHRSAGGDYRSRSGWNGRVDIDIQNGHVNEPLTVEQFSAAAQKIMTELGCPGSASCCLNIYGLRFLTKEASLERRRDQGDHMRLGGL